MNDIAKNRESIVSNGSASQPRASKVKSVARQSQSSLPNIDLPFLLGVFRKGWFWILPLGLLISAVAGGVIFSLFRPTYEARFRLEVDTANFVVFQDVKNYSGEFVELQKAVLLGTNVLEKVLAEPSLSSIPRYASSRDPIVQLRKDVKVTAAAGNRLMDVKYANEDPVVSARLVNSVVDEYLRARRTMEQIKTSALERNVMAALQKAESEVESAKQRVRELSLQAIKTENVVGEKETGRIDTAYLDELRMKRMELVSQMAIAEINMAEAVALSEDKKDGTPKTESPTISDAELEADVSVSAAMLQLDVAKQDLSDMANVRNVGENNPSYIRGKRRVEALEQELKRVKDLKRRELATRLMGGDLGPDSLSLRIAQMQNQINEMKTKKATIESQVREYMASLKQSSASSVDLQFAEADLEEWNEIRATVHNRRIQLQTEREAQDSVRELERATPPRIPVEELPYKQLGLATLGGLAVPFLLAVLLEIRNRKVDDANQLESRSQLAVLGEIANIPVRTGRKDPHSSRDLKLFEESVDSLSTTLILRDNLRDARVFAVTSALSGEGKTSVACQLAVSIARATGKKVLLIDGDMRSPDVHHVFGRSMTHGLVGYLSHEGDWRDFLDTGWSESVHFLTAGHLRGSPHRLLSGDLLEKLITEARQEYDYLIIDTPPVLAASEALLFARSADACLVCALRDKSRIEQLIQAYHRLDASGAQVAGSVLSGVPTREYANYYGEYYKSS
jgi:capsular exopolysaccharide synthesis family protein